MNSQLESIQEAYAGILSEGVKPKFKSGDKVGVGSYSYDGQYVPHGTGTVSNVTKFGDHEVTIDSHPEMIPQKHLFAPLGNSLRTGDPRSIISLDQHNSNVANNVDHAQRRSAFGTVLNHINALRNGLGNYSKLDKSQADHIKSLIDAHTKE